MKRAFHTVPCSKVSRVKRGSAAGALARALSAQPASRPSARQNAAAATLAARGKRRDAAREDGRAAERAVPSTEASRSNARSRADWKRSAGLFSRLCRRIRSRAGGRSAPGLDASSSGSAWRIAVIVSAPVGFWKARRPVSIS